MQVSIGLDIVLEDHDLSVLGITMGPEELTMCQEDDILMWSQIFLFLVADMPRKLKDSTCLDVQERKEKNGIMFLLEQPADPKGYMPECVRFGDTGMEVITESCQSRALHGQPR